ncbi:MAG: hypothetical protein ACKOIZ_09035, partial [Actinomycetota bacterium]
MFAAIAAPTPRIGSGSLGGVSAAGVAASASCVSVMLAGRRTGNVSSRVAAPFAATATDFAFGTARDALGALPA